MVTVSRPEMLPGAMYRPFVVGEKLPGLAPEGFTEMMLQLTAWGPLKTVAVNCCVPLAARPTLWGAIVTDSGAPPPPPVEPVPVPKKTPLRAALGPAFTVTLITTLPEIFQTT